MEDLCDQYIREARPSRKFWGPCANISRPLRFKENIKILVYDKISPSIKLTMLILSRLLSQLYLDRFAIVNCWPSRELQHSNNFNLLCLMYICRPVETGNSRQWRQKSILSKMPINLFHTNDNSTSKKLQT